MDMELADQTFLIVKGYIDAKDERQRTVHGSILGVVSRRSTKYLSVTFSREAAWDKKSWDELLLLHKDKHNDSERDPSMVYNEEELYKYLDISRALNSIAKNHNTKQAEQSVSRFCMEQLHLKAVSFIDYIEAAESEIKRFDVPSEHVEKPETSEAEREETETVEADEPKGDVKNGADFFIRCDPILDPVHGVAMSELSVGDYVFVRLADDSVFYKLLAKNVPNFNGIVTAQVSGLLVNELGTAAVSLSLADGISGVMKLSGKVRVRTAPGPEGAEDSPVKRPFHLASLSPQVVFVGAGLLVLLAAAMLILYLL